ncbi:TPA: 3'-5' exoribonuclease [Vibrio vulnificus]|uniref:3'-5' exoribonuclease domain-containing protein n=2 Tax=Vibrio vulnificus TaxID=672 RepID=UPI0024DFB715|nr:3'-5' exoribonuclease [Vibrio vulnificus]EJI1280455.1 3'-5' exoribonuclease [Vibrio vulnificus]MDK2621827.1 3'-5' exoribonuclease [Vibrio vulnificus]
MRLFLDTEFTGLKQDAELLSLALVDEHGRAFYAECQARYGASVDKWIVEHVLAHTRWLSLPSCAPSEWLQEGEVRYGFDSDENIAHQLKHWLSQYERVELWADCPAYDWVLFCQLFGGSQYLPRPLSYVVNDFATLLTLQGLDPLLPRISLLAPNQQPQGQPHNALYDARLLKACFTQLIAEK